MTTLEKMARAICREHREQTASYDGAADLEDWVNEMWGEWLPEARAALSSLREPSEGMMAASEHAMDNIPRTGVVPENTERALDGWVAAIDFALSEKE